ncbi:MAG: hypothetical protein KF729_30115 [Sandaracinaceae bacterium]|nr:hypothetical protein [Sandaracinaceae bacterium]
MRTFGWSALGFALPLAAAGVVAFALLGIDPYDARLDQGEVEVLEDGVWTSSGPGCPGTTDGAGPDGTLERTCEDGRMQRFDLSSRVWDDTAPWPPLCVGTPLGDGRRWTTVQDGMELVIRAGWREPCDELARGLDLEFLIERVVALDAGAVLILGYPYTYDVDANAEPLPPVYSARLVHDGEIRELSVPWSTSVVASAALDATQAIAFTDDRTIHFFDLGAQTWSSRPMPDDVSELFGEPYQTPRGVAFLVATTDGDMELREIRREDRSWTTAPAWSSERQTPSLAVLEDGLLAVHGGYYDSTLSTPRAVLQWLIALSALPLLVIGVVLAAREKRLVPTLLGAAGGVGVLLLIAAAFWVLALLFGSMAHGRPSRRAGGRQPRLRTTKRRPRGAPAPRLADRVALAIAWGRDARLEAASVATFLELADDLRRAGAPDALVAWAEQAADEERAHAKACAALASRHAGVALEAPPAEPLPPPDESAEESLVRMAREALVDGCLGEGYASAALTAARARTSDPEAHDVVERLAQEEARHAELAWAVLAFCLARGGEPVRREVERLLDDASFGVPHRGARPSAGALRRAAHGRFVEAQPGALAREVRAAVAERARRLLS